MSISMLPGRKTDEPRRGLAALLAAVGISGLGAGIWLALLPGEGGPLLGYSWPRAALLAALFLPSLVLIGLAVKAWRARSERVEKAWGWLSRPGLLAAAGLTALLSLTLLLPPYWFGGLAAYYARLRPLLAWLGLSALFTLAAVGLQHGLYLSRLREELRGQVSLRRAAALLALAGILVWVLARFTSLGSPDDRFWHEAGVPVLGVQVLLSLALASVLGWLMRNHKNRAWFETLLMLGLWGLAVILWAREPLMRTYFTPGPYPPAMQVYPFSDAAYYDAGGQYLLLGKVIDNTYQVDKPLYMLFLGILHALAGQDYTRVMFLQVLVLALQPVLIYLLGREMHSRPAGLLTALLLIFQERNAIAAGTIIQLAHVRLMLTETLTALLLLWLGLLLLRWWSQKSPGWPVALLSGAVLGTVLLVRANPLVLLPLIILAMLAIFRRRIGRWAVLSAVFLLGVILPMLPWTIASAQHTGEFYILNKINLVLDARYGEDDLPAPTLAPQPTPSAVKPDAALLPPSNKPASSGPGWFVPAHFTHNLWMSALILPHSFSLNDLPHTLDAPYWLSIRTWDGRLPLAAGILMLLNLALLAVGTGCAWQRFKLAGLAPLILLLGYHLANALGRTSGARYLVPVDWVILLYYTLGLVQTLYWLRLLLTGRERSAQDEPVTRAERHPRWALGAAAGLMLLGVLIPLSGALFPERYTAKTSAQAAADLTGRLSLRLEPGGVTEADLSNFLQSGGVVVEGRALYPRFYAANTGEPHVSVTRPYDARAYPRMIFTLLGAERKWTVLLPAQTPLNIPDAADVVLLGCWNADEEFLDAAALFTFEASGQTFSTRQPSRPLLCPLPPPVCNDNRECR